MLPAASIALDGTSSLRLPSPTEAAAFGYLGVLVTATAFLLWYDALRRLGAARAGLFAGPVPVGALVTTVAPGPGEAGSAGAAGVLLVTAGVLTGLRQPAPTGVAGRAGRPVRRPRTEEEGRAPASSGRQ
ncbi:EamA family transporter [Streptomyces sp. NPDC014623]|uniref:EamA family transporter n=1 Tax=Streptomyces sp. NPDC014623 TaxID=3364875 RepID=UPI003700588E